MLKPNVALNGRIQPAQKETDVPTNGVTQWKKENPAQQLKIAIEGIRHQTINMSPEITRLRKLNMLNQINSS